MTESYIHFAMSLRSFALHFTITRFSTCLQIMKMQQILVFASVISSKKKHLLW